MFPINFIIPYTWSIYLLKEWSMLLRNGIIKYKKDETREKVVDETKKIIIT